MEKTSFETLPGDIQMDILLLMPLKSLMKFMCLSKKWTSIIRGEKFRRDYLLRSMTRPRVLFVANPSLRILPSEVLFHSVYQEEEPLFSGIQQMRTNETPLVRVSQPIRGLICHEGHNKIVICNPGLKKFRSLPIQVPKGASTRSFFGYDEVRDVFKVLCITSFGDGKRSEVTNNYQVYTMTSDEESSYWRPVICKHDHAPFTQGLFKGGVLYYGAKSNISDTSVVMSFNVSSEDFSVIDLPKEVELNHQWRLVNYKGDIALIQYGEYSRLTQSGVIEMWVRNEVDGNWKRNSIKISHWKETFDNMVFYFKGTIGTKELAFAPHRWIGEQLFVLFSDADATKFRRFEIEGMVDQDHLVRTFFDHVDSTWLI